MGQLVNPQHQHCKDDQSQTWTPTPLQIILVRNVKQIQGNFIAINLNPVFLTHWSRDKMDAISQTTFSSAFSWKKNVWFPIKISQKFVPKGPINNISALVQIMAWHRPGEKLLSEPLMVSLLTHLCVTRPQKYLCKVHNCRYACKQAFDTWNILWKLEEYKWDSHQKNNA